MSAIPPLTATTSPAWFAAVARANSAIGAFVAFADPPAAIGAGPLAGLPVAIKDNIDVRGLPTRAGLGGTASAVPADAPIVARLRAAGAVILGKSKMDEAALGGAGDNPHWGRTANPRAPSRSSGGSSGGSAAAVAAGFCAAALGSDTMGSVRIPAAYCGVVGLKPTRGLLPTAGMVPLSPSLDDLGILAADVDGVALMLDAGTDRPRRPRDDAVPATIGVPTALAACRIAPAIAASFAATRVRLRQAGHHLAEVTIENWTPDRLRRAAFLLVEAEGAEVHRALLAADGPALSPGVRRLLLYGRDCALGKLVAARREFAAMAEGLARVFAEVDFLLLPTTTHTAFAGHAAPPLDQADLTVLANVGGLPAISLPSGLDAAGLPIGMQLIGRAFAEDRLLALARSIAFDL